MRRGIPQADPVEILASTRVFDFRKVVEFCALFNLLARHLGGFRIVRVVGVLHMRNVARVVIAPDGGPVDQINHVSELEFCDHLLGCVGLDLGNPQP